MISPITCLCFALAGCGEGSGTPPLRSQFGGTAPGAEAQPATVPAPPARAAETGPVPTPPSQFGGTGSAAGP